MSDGGSRITGLTRRRYLAAAAVGSISALAGCGGIPSPSSPSPSPSSSPSPLPPRSPRPTTPSEVPTTEPGTETPSDTPTPEPTTIPETIFVEDATLRALKRRVKANKQPWYTAFEMLHRDADRALGATPESVVDNGAPHNVDDPHKYGTDAPYQGKDGKFSDKANRGDYFAALHMSKWIRDLGMAYGFTGEDQYAQKAIDLLHHWFVDPRTRMYPSARNYGPHTEGLLGQNAIEHYITIPAMLYGADYVIGHPHWDRQGSNAERALNRWVEKYQADLEDGDRHDPTGDGIYKWWIVNRAVVDGFLRDTAALSRCFDDWRTKAFNDFEPRGTFKFARWRTRSLYYSFSALNALTTTAEIARHFGVDLYGHEVDGTNRLRVALEYHAPYLANPRDWPWKELGGLERFEREFGGVSYELAYSHWRDETFYQAVKAAGRPVFDQRVLGWTTLTHGNLFEIDV